MNETKLQLEINPEIVDKTPIFEAGGIKAMITPPIGEEYWAYRVKLSEEQAILGFPKFGVIGIGFAKEEDWNTNLPSGYDTIGIFDHIKHNKGDDSIADSDCIEAIKMIQQAVKLSKEAGNN